MARPVSPPPDVAPDPLPSLADPARHAVAVTPNDAADLSAPVRALYVGTGGDVTVTMLGGQTVTFAAVAAGTALPLRVTRVHATGTTAGNLVGLW